MLPMASLIVAAALTASGGDDGPTTEVIRAAVERAIPPLQTGMAGYIKQRECFSCHHQGVPTLALTIARDRGLTVDEEVLRGQVEHTEADLSGAIESFRTGYGQGGGATRAGYALWTLAIGGHEPNETTAAVVSYLLRRDRERDHWTSSSKRPPSEFSPFTSTFVALEGLKAFGTDDQADSISRRVAQVRDWLVASPGEETEDRVFRLLALHASDAVADPIREAADNLLHTQHDDGGWSQRDGSESDAYATGSALYALHRTGQITPDSPVYRRGLAYLIDTQGDDGTWHVVSRSHPFQTYFESGFPHGPDQFISMSATAWATASLALALPERSP